MKRDLPKPGSNKENPNGSSPDILSYTDFRQFLNDYYLSHKQTSHHFSLRFFARKVNFSSHGMLKYVMDGKRNLTKKTMLKMALALDFSKEQSQYFENLVFFNQAASLEEKNYFYEKLLQVSGKSSFKILESSQLQIFKNWYSIAILEMLNLRNFRNSAQWIARQLVPNISVPEAEEALNVLMALGLIKKTANSYCAADPDISTNAELKSFLVKNYHVQLLRIAAKAMDEFRGSERDVSSVCFAVNKNELPNLKKQIQLMRKELKKFEAAKGDGDQVMQVNIQAFPVTKGR